MRKLKNRLLVLMLMMVTSTAALAEVISGSCGENVTYAFDSVLGTMTIQGTGEMQSCADNCPWAEYRDNIKNVIIQDGVTKISDFSFRNCTSISNVYISNSVKEIGQYAFSGCTTLTYIKIPGSVIQISQYAFSDCSELTSLVMDSPDKSTVAQLSHHAFSGCSKLTSVNLHDQFKSIGFWAFSGCTSLTSPIYNKGFFIYMPASYTGTYTIPDNVVITGRSFEDSYGTTSVVVPDMINSIGMYAFNNAPSLTSITIGSSVYFIGESALSNIPTLKELVLRPITPPNVASGAISEDYIDKVKLIVPGESYNDYKQHEFWGMFKNIECRTYFDIEIDNNEMFAGASQEVRIKRTPDIENEPIAWASSNINVASVNNGVITANAAGNATIIAMCAGMSAMCEITVKEKIATGNCGENLTYSLDLETGTLTIKGSGEMEAFDGKIISGKYRTTAPWGEYYDKISSVIIEDGVTNISSEAFCGCSNISSIEISNTVKTIERYAFEFCRNLYSIAIPASVTNIQYYAFNNSSISAINVASNNNSYSSIDGVLFSKDKSTLIKYPEYRAGDSYEIPNTVTTIGHEAFSGASLTSVSIPNSVSSIESWAFQSCPLKSVNIPYSVTFIDYGTFVGCYSLTSINVENGNNYYCSADGVLFDKNKTELVQYPINKKGSIYEIPNSVTNIGVYAFYRCSNLSSIVIPNSVTNIGNYAFGYCSNLPSIVIPDSVTNIEVYAFYGCENLSSVSIGKSVTNIGYNAFYGNKKISEITLYPTTPPTVGSYIFSNDVYNTAKLIVPGESYEEYKQHETWGKFKNIEYTSSFRVFTNANEMVVGESQKLQVKCSPNMANESISWSSSGSSIATVEKGVVTAKAVGTATITATCGGFVSECTITVVDKKKSEIVFGYCDDYVGGGIGNGTDQLIKCAIRIPASVLSNYKGCTITRIDVGVSDNVTQLVPVISTGGEENHATQAGRNGISGWNELELASPYAIGGDKDLYVGYQCVGTYAAGLSNIKSKYGSYISSGNEWEDYSDRDWGSFCIRVHIKGFDLPIDVVLTSDQIIECEVGQTVFLQSNVQNLSPEKINSLKLGYYIDNEYKGSKELTLDIEKGNIVPVSIPVTAPASSGIYTVKLEVESVNGKKDEVAANNTATIPLAIAGKTYDRKVVIEEITGTWCGWCIRGYVGMKEMAEKYPDNFIGIAVHGGDEMAGAVNYNGIFNLLGGSYPSCVANRNMKFKSGASPYEMEQAILAMKEKALAEIKAEMYVLDSDTTELLIKTHTEFGLNASSPFRIAYVVVENGVGPYAQANYYSDYISMGGFENEGEYVALTFNDVARGIYGSFNGVEGSVPSSVKLGQVYDYEYRLRMPSNVDCKSNVEVVTLLINQKTGEIMNAYKCHFDESADAINSIDSVINQQVEVYSLGGIKQNTPRRGVNIVRMSDGTVKKVMVK